MGRYILNLSKQCYSYSARDVKSVWCVWLSAKQMVLVLPPLTQHDAGMLFAIELKQLEPSCCMSHCQVKHQTPRFTYWYSTQGLEVSTIFDISTIDLTELCWPEIPTCRLCQSIGWTLGFQLPTREKNQCAMALQMWQSSTKRQVHHLERTWPSMVLFQSRYQINIRYYSSILYMVIIGLKNVWFIPNHLLWDVLQAAIVIGLTLASSKLGQGGKAWPRFIPKSPAKATDMTRASRRFLLLLNFALTIWFSLKLPWFNQHFFPELWNVGDPLPSL